MQSNELESIAQAMQEALHRAYALGRSDALRRVVEMVQSDDLGARTVPLLSHSPSQPLQAPEPMPEPEADMVPAAEPAGEVLADAGQPVGAGQPVAGHADPGLRESPGPGESGAPAPSRYDGGRSETPPGSVKDFLLDYLYPLGGKKK